MTNEHIKTQWHISDNKKMPYLIYNNKGYAVADCKVYHGKSDIKSDMNLIAAAPEMLEALESVLPDLKHYISIQGAGPDKRLEAVISAIKKAKGE